MKRLLFTLSAWLVFSSPLNAQENEINKVDNVLPSCDTYQNKLGISFRGGRGNSFQLLSTTAVKVRNDDTGSIFKALKEAKLKAKANIAKFIKSTNNPNSQILNNQNLTIRVNGRTIKTKNQLKRRLKKISIGTAAELTGIRQKSNCYQQGQYVMTTLEVTNDTIDAAKTLGNYMKRN